MNDNERYMLTNLKQKLIPRSLTADHSVSARKRPRTCTEIEIYIFFKKSLHSSHQHRYSEVSCASLAALWALLCCTASNEGALNGSMNEKKKQINEKMS